MNPETDRLVRSLDKATRLHGCSIEVVEEVGDRTFIQCPVGEHEMMKINLPTSEWKVVEERVNIRLSYEDFYGAKVVADTIKSIHNFDSAINQLHLCAHLNMESSSIADYHSKRVIEFGIPPKVLIEALIDNQYK